MASVKLTNPYTGGQVDVPQDNVEKFKGLGFIESEPAPTKKAARRSTSEKSED